MRPRLCVLALTVPLLVPALAACSSGDGEAQDTTSSSGDPSSAVARQVGLDLSVGDCLADLGSESRPGEPTTSASATAPATTSASAKAPASRSSSATSEPASTSAAASGTTSASAAVPTTANRIDTVDCDREHAGEVFAQEKLDDVLYPGQGPTKDRAAELCTGDDFADFVGTDFGSSALDVVTYVPSKESWAAKDRTVSCVVTDPAEPTTGSLEDAHR